MRKALLLIGLLALTGLAKADETQVIGPFGGLNTQDSPQIIGSNQAQDLLNVRINEGGRSVIKRDGYSLDNAFSVSTSAIHGGYKFFDASGNEVRLWGQDSGLWGSVSGASYVKIATGTVGATWQCTDYLGQAYCVNSARDTPVRTNGTTSGTTFQGTIPAGTMVASTPERLLVGGTAANPSRLYYSAASNLTDFTVGSTASSSSFEDISSPGSRLAHIAYRYGKWMWWKDQSFGFFVGTNQFDLQLVTIANNLGTLDNESVYDQGITFFRGNDNNFYLFDGANYSRISRDITPTVQAANRRKANSWTQSSQAEFATGSINLNGPSLALSTNAVSGSVVLSTVSLEDTNSVDFASGTYTEGISTGSITGAITLSNYTSETFASGLGTFTNSPLPSNTGTAQNDGSGHMTCNTNNVNCSAVTTNAVDMSSNVVIQMTIGENAGNGDAQIYISSAQFGQGVGIRFNNGGSDALWACQGDMESTNYNCAAAPLCTATGITAATPSTMALAIYSTGTVNLYWNGELKCSSNTIVSLSTFSYVRVKLFTSNLAGGNWLDDVYASARTGAFTSRTFDTAFSTPIYGALASGYSNITSSTSLSFAYKCSSAPTTAFTSWTSISSGTVPSCSHKRYFVYSATMTALTPAQLPIISSVSVSAVSTGTYLSSINNAPNLTSWSSFGVTDTTLADGGSIAYFTRSSTNAFTVNSSTPSWVSQTANATVSASTGTYFQMRADFNVTAATQSPKLSDFTFNWFEGTASDKMYGIYFDYAAWFSVSLGTAATTNNKILRYDLLNQLWTVYDIPVNGFLTYNGALYLGDSTVGKTYLYGNSQSDNGATITAYWKSKDFFGNTPFIDKDMKTMSWYCKQSSGTTLSVAYTVNASSTTTYSVNLYDARSNVIRHNRNLPLTTANVFSVQLGDTSSNRPWECYAGQYTYFPKPWTPTTP